MSIAIGSCTAHVRRHMHAVEHGRGTGGGISGTTSQFASGTHSHVTCLSRRDLIALILCQINSSLTARVLGSEPLLQASLNSSIHLPKATTRSSLPMVALEGYLLVPKSYMAP